MTQEQCKSQPLLAILNGWHEFKKIGDWREEKVSTGRDAGFILELTHPWSSYRFAKVSTLGLDEEDADRLARGEAVWLQFDQADLVDWID